MREIAPLRIPALAAALLMAVAPGVAAQEIAGTARLADGTPARGVLVIAQRDADASPLARTLSGPDGGFRLRLPTAATVRLRALRVGFRPTDLGLVTVGPGQVVPRDITLGADAVVLQAVTTRAEERCEPMGSAAASVVDLFEEARKALLSTQSDPPAGRPRARILLETRVVGLDGRPRGPALREMVEGLGSRPFRAVPASQLAVLGYAVTDATGTTFYAPDANVLLSEQFAAGHCFRLVPPPRDDTSRVGLGFEPSGRKRGVVGIRGTLWLERRSYALQRVEYAYVGLSTELERARLGGFVEFTRLDDGLWFEDRWEIRMPRMVLEARGYHCRDRGEPREPHRAARRDPDHRRARRLDPAGCAASLSRRRARYQRDHAAALPRRRGRGPGRAGGRAPLSGRRRRPRHPRSAQGARRSTRSCCWPPAPPPTRHCARAWGRSCGACSAPMVPRWAARRCRPAGARPSGTCAASSSGMNGPCGSAQARTAATRSATSRAGAAPHRRGRGGGSAAGQPPNQPTTSRLRSLNVTVRNSAPIATSPIRAYHSLTAGGNDRR